MVNWGKAIVPDAAGPTVRDQERLLVHLSLQMASATAASSLWVRAKVCEDKQREAGRSGEKAFGEDPWCGGACLTT